MLSFTMWRSCSCSELFWNACSCFFGLESSFVYLFPALSGVLPGCCTLFACFGGCNRASARFLVFSNPANLLQHSINSNSPDGPHFQSQKRASKRWVPVIDHKNHSMLSTSPRTTGYIFSFNVEAYHVEARVGSKKWSGTLFLEAFPL